MIIDESKANYLALPFTQQEIDEFKRQAADWTRAQKISQNSLIIAICMVIAAVGWKESWWTLMQMFGVAVVVYSLSLSVIPYLLDTFYPCRLSIDGLPVFSPTFGQNSFSPVDGFQAMSDQEKVFRDKVMSLKRTIVQFEYELLLQHRNEGV